MDNKEFIDRLNKTTNDILQTVKPCSPEQLHFKQEGRWNILEILEHICLTDKVIYTIISRPSIDTNPSTEIVGNDRMKKILVEQRDQRINAPEFLKPKGEIKDLNSFEKTFLAQRETFKNDISTGKIVVDNRVHKHPLLNEMTITDWLNLTIHHTQRHIEQIKDIING